MRKFVLFLVVSVLLMPCKASSGANTIRVATFNIAMGLEEQGQMSAALASGNDPRLQQVAEILRRVRPDVVLLNEFDFDPGVDAAALFNEGYVGVAGPRIESGVTENSSGVTENSSGVTESEPVLYPYSFQAPVNTGVDSGLDLDGDGRLGGPGDAWGFGRFPGQFGMLVLSRFPVKAEKTRSFQHFRWAALPGARRPLNADGTPFYPDEVWRQLRLSSKSHWDVVIEIDGEELHLLAHHPTPPVFDGPENRNGLRNFDEIRFWREYTNPAGAHFIVDDAGQSGGLDAGARFVVAGDFNADPYDGDSVENAIGQLLEAEWINGDCVPLSAGGKAAAQRQGGVNQQHRGDPAADTADFSDKRAGNLRLDYVLPSTNLAVVDCGVFWPEPNEDGHELAGVSDHRLVWLDLSL
jgi:endonuclease/exonuclease/phosphatase family metal-dependent hydrolase